MAQDADPELKPKQVLALFVFKQGLPWTNRVEESMRAALKTKSNYPIKLNVEHADQARFPEKAYRSKIIDLYRYKYSKQKMDLVIGVGEESVSLLLEHGKELFGDVPMVLITTKYFNLPPGRMTPNMMHYTWGFDFVKTGKIIQDLLPKTKHLYVISGTSSTDKQLTHLAGEALSESEGRFTIHYLDDFSFEDLLLKVTQLPEDSAIFFLSLFRDVNGESFVPRDILPAIAEKANAPTFGIVDLYLGHGIVGGNLLSADSQGKKYIEIIDKILKGESLTNWTYEKNANQAIFDWRQLKRWSIDEDRLPAGSIIRYREASLWLDHKWEIVGIFLIICIQALALLALIVQHRRRCRAEEESQRLRDECAHISRVMSMGEIAASLAHELNQPLSAIRSYAQAAQRFLANDPAEPEEACRALAGIVVGNRRAEEVIKRIRMALKKEPFNRVRLNVKEVIQEVIMLLNSKARDQNILLRLELAADLPPVLGDHIQLQQVLFNLIINAIEAMGDKGNGYREIVVLAVRVKSDFVTLSVRDSGVGIDEKEGEILFDTFYTTKTEGMGMGLSISRSIIEEHGGRLWATRNLDKGSTFSFTVPIYEEHAK